MTWSPAALSTGRLSPVSMLSSTAVAPVGDDAVDRHLLAGADPHQVADDDLLDRDVDLGAVAQHARGLRRAGPTRAVIAAAVRFLACASIHRPARTRARITSDVSKYTCSGRPHRSAAAGQRVTKAL